MKKQDNAIVGIYKITNPINEVYIGQSTNIENRKTYYMYLKSKGQPKIYDSIKNYGWEQHIFEIIEKCPIDMLDLKEEEYKTKYIKDHSWEKALFCRLKDGKGGLDSPETKLKKSLAQIGISKSSTHIQNMRKPKPQGFGNKISQRKFTWNENLQEGIIKSKSTPIYQYDLHGNFIKEWSTIAEPLKLGFGDVDAALRGRQKTAGGYIWKFKK
jgi:group I intron endonuclease